MPQELLANLTRWWPSQLDWSREPALWVIASLLAGVLAFNLLWMAQRRSTRVARVTASPGGQFAGWLLRLSWLLGPGYAALLMGVLSPRLMGLTQVDWGTGLGYGLAFTVSAWAILLTAGLVYRRAGHSEEPWPSAATALAGSTQLALDAGALQWHWAFYRSVAISAATALGFDQPASWGTWVAVVVIGLQGASNPLLWRDLRRPGLAERRILRAVLLVASSVLYLLSRNFWLAWALHGLPTLLLMPRLSGPPARKRATSGGQGRR